MPVPPPLSVFPVAVRECLAKRLGAFFLVRTQPLRQSIEVRITIPAFWSDSDEVVVGPFLVQAPYETARLRAELKHADLDTIVSRVCESLARRVLELLSKHRTTPEKLSAPLEEDKVGREQWLESLYESLHEAGSSREEISMLLSLRYRVRYRSPMPSSFFERIGKASVNRA